MKIARLLPRLVYTVPPQLEDYLRERAVALDALTPLVDRAVSSVAAQTPPSVFGGITVVQRVQRQDSFVLPNGSAIELEVVVSRRDPWWYALFVLPPGSPLDALPIPQETDAVHIHERPGGVAIVTVARADAGAPPGAVMVPLPSLAEALWVERMERRRAEGMEPPQAWI